MLDALLVPNDEQVKSGLSNFRIALEKSQPNVIYKVCLVILQQHSLFNAFIRTANTPEIYMQQFWHTVHYDLTAKAYLFRIDDQTFKVNAKLLSIALQITLEVSDHPFVTPPPKKKSTHSSTSLDTLNANEEKAAKEKVADEQTRDDQAKESVPEPHSKKPTLPHPSFSQTLSSTEYGNQFINDNPEVSLTDKAAKKSMPKYSSTLFDQASLDEYDQKDKLLKMMRKSMSYNKHSAYRALYYAPMQSLVINEDDIDKQLKEQSTSKKRRRYDNDQDPQVDSEKEKKKRKKKDYESDVIKAFDDYSKYLAKSSRTQPTKGKGKGQNTKKDLEVDLKNIRVLKKKRTKTVFKESAQNLKKARKASKDDFILQQRPKGLGEGSGMALGVPDRPSLKGLNEESGVTPVVPNEPSGSSSRSSSDADDEIKYISSDDERSEANKTDKANEEKAAKEKVADEQTKDDQAKESVPEPHSKKPTLPHPSFSQTLSSTEYGNQFINDNPEVSLTDVLKEPKAEVQSLTWFNEMLNAEKNQLTFDDVMGSVIYFTNFTKNYLKKDKITKADLEGPSFKLIKDRHITTLIELEYNFKQFYLALVLGCLAILVDFFFNKDLEYLITRNVEKKYATSLIKPKAARVESYQTKLNLMMLQVRCVGLDNKEPYTIFYKPKGVVYLNKDEKKYLMREDELYKFGDGTIKKVRDKLNYRLYNFVLGYNEGMPKRAWSEKDQRRTKSMLKEI
nr:hypothetical protein [Tanacetum cinerariifolium]